MQPIEWNWGFVAQSEYSQRWMWNVLPYSMRKIDTPWTPNMTSGLGIEMPPVRKSRGAGLAARVTVWVPIIVILALALLGL